jgi:hypothetical protein
MPIQKEHQMILGHLQPKRMGERQMDVKLNNIKQLDRPSDNRNMIIGTQKK